MRSFWNRSMAFVLVLCMLLSVMPPVVLATGGSAQPDTVTYDFTGVEAIRAASLNAANEAVLDGLFSNGTINWKFEGRCTNSGAVQVGGTKADGSATKDWDGINFAMKPGGGWIAIRVKAPAAGTYKVSVNYHTHRDHGEVAVYQLPVSTSDIDAAIGTASALGTYNCKVAGANYGDGSAELTGNAVFAAEEESLFVFYLPNAGTGNLYATVNGITLEKVTPAPQETTAPSVSADQMVYDFDLGHSSLTCEDKVFGNRNLTHAAVANAVAGYYEAGTLDWKYHSVGKGSGVSAFMLFGGIHYNNSAKEHMWNGICMYSKTSTPVTGTQFALTLRSPGEGNYKLTLDYGAKYTGASSGSVYLLPGDTTNIAAAITAANKLGSVNYENAAANNAANAVANTITFDKVLSMEDGEEYILVFVADTAGSRDVYMYADCVTLDKVEGSSNETTAPETTTVPEETTGPEETTAPEETVPEESNEGEYDFTEVAAVHGTSFAYGNATLDALYASGEIDWTYAGKSTNSQAAMMGGTHTSGTPSRAWTGMAFAMRTGGGWVAYRVKSPGTGSYQVTANYQTRNNYGEVQVYVLPGSTTDIEAALSGATALGKYDCYKAGGAFADASATLSKTADFVAGEEYIFVFYLANENSTPLYATINGISVAPYTGPAGGGSEDEQEPQYPVPPAQRSEVKYNFDLGNSALLLKGATFANARVTDSVVTGEIGKYYSLYALDWKFHSTMENTRPIAYFGGTNGTVNNLWNGIRVYAKNAENTANIANHYLAMTLRSPGTGTYYMTLDYQMHRFGAGKGSVYVLPGDTTDIAAAIAAATPVGTVNYDNRGLKNADPAQDAQAVFTAPISCEAGKEYIVVFVSEKAGKQGSSHMYIEQVTLTHSSVMVFPQPDPETNLQTDQLVYDFDLGATELLCQDKTFATRNLTHAAVSSAVYNYYRTGALDWYYHSATKDLKYFALIGGKSGDKEYKNTGVQFYSRDAEDNYIHNYYYAMVIRAPGTGNYKLTLDYGVHKTGAKQGSIYILPGDTEDIAAAIAAGKALGTVNYDNGSNDSSVAPELGRSTYGNAIAMESGKEYILVFTADMVGRNSSRLFIDSVMLTKEGVATPSDIIPYRKPEPEPIPAGSTVYDVDLNDSVNGIYKTKTYVLDALDDISSRYDKGLSNWSWAGEDCVNVGTMAFMSTGLAVYGSEFDWIALKIKSPGEGLHTIGINHADNANGGVGAIYILPADTQDIGKALDSSNRVGKVLFHNDTGDTAVADGKRTYMGTWEFGSEEEYIVVLEAYERSPYAETRAYMYISQLFMTPGDIMPEAEQTRVIRPMVADPGPIKLLEATLYGTTAKVNGNDCLFMPTEGGRILVLDLDNEMLVDQFNTPFTVPRGMTTDENGIVWIVGDTPLIYRYDPVSRTGQEIKRYKDLIPGAQSSFDLYYGDGCLYFGTYPTGTVVKYNIATDTYLNYGRFFDDANYCCGVAYKDGYVYAAINGDQNGDGVETWKVAKIDTVKDELVTMTDFSDWMPETANMVRGANFAGDLLILAGESDQRKIVAIDINTMDLVDLGFEGGINYGITEEVDGKVYFVVNTRGLFSMDVETREITAVPGLNELNIGVRCDNTSIVEVDNPLYPGINIVTYSASTGIPRIYNIEKGIVKSYNEVFDADELGVPTDIRCITSMGEGTNEFMIGAYNTDKCVIYNTQTGQMREFETEGQTDALHMYKGIAYAGNYNDGRLVRLNLENPELNQVLMTLNDELYDQSRIHTITAGEDKIFVGSTPDLYGYGGVLAWIDLDKMERFVATDVVKEQTINCIVYHDGYIYGSTSIHGGTGSALRSDLSAKLFIYDVANKQKVGEYDLRDYMSGFTGNIEFIAGIAADPNVDENGRFWGVVGETLFSYTFDKTTGKIDVKEELDFGKNTYNIGGGRNWFPRAFRFDGEGNLYVAFDANGGMRRINTQDTSDNERIMPETPKYYILGEDGNLYYNTSGSVMKMYPLNVTEDNWAEAEKVDVLILDIGNDITMDSEEKIVAARTAYDALEMKNRALVQNLETLQEAEVDLFELKIDELPETIELSHQALIEGLLATYNAMTTRQQMYVKNYDALSAAQDALNILLDKQAAAKVQAMIDSIKDLGQLTLDYKDRIAEIRAAYNGLTSYQKIYVDTTELLKAELIMAELRAAEIERLKGLIASIGEVTLEDEPVIVEADGIFSWLTLEERQQVDGATLSSAKIALTKLQKAAAGEVDALIGKIGKVGIFSGISISKARKAYDALTEGSKAYVSLIDTLLAAEKAFVPLRIVFWSGIVAIAAAGGIVTVVVVNKKKQKAAKTAVPETETAE